MLRVKFIVPQRDRDSGLRVHGCTEQVWLWDSGRPACHFYKNSLISLAASEAAGPTDVKGSIPEQMVAGFVPQTQL